jgi:hypothetical protein
MYPMCRGDLIPMTQFEKELAIDLGVQRFKYDGDAGIKDRIRDTNRSGLDISIMGAGGQLMAEKKFGIYPDLIVDDPTKRYDFVHNGVRFEVKTVEDTHHNLLIPKHQKHHDVDWYILMYGLIGTMDPVYLCLGYYPKNMAIRRRLYKKTEENQFYFINQNELFMQPQPRGE